MTHELIDRSIKSLCMVLKWQHGVYLVDSLESAECDEDGVMCCSAIDDAGEHTRLLVGAWAGCPRATCPAPCPSERYAAASASTAVQWTLTSDSSSLFAQSPPTPRISSWTFSHRCFNHRHKQHTRTIIWNKDNTHSASLTMKRYINIPSI